MNVKNLKEVEQMKVFLNNLYHDNMKRICYFLYEKLHSLAQMFQTFGMRHDIRHILMEEDRKRMSEWFDDFERKINEEY